MGGGQVRDLLDGEQRADVPARAELLHPAGGRGERRGGGGEKVVADDELAAGAQGAGGFAEVAVGVGAVNERLDGEGQVGGAGQVVRAGRGSCLRGSARGPAAPAAAISSAARAACSGLMVMPSPVRSIWPAR